MGKCCSKSEKEEYYQEEVQEVLLDVDPGGGEGADGDIKMSGGTLVVRTPGKWQVTTTREIPISATTTTTKKFITTPGSKTGSSVGTGKVITKTFRFDGKSSATPSVDSFSGSSIGKSSTTTKCTGSTSTTTRGSSGDGSPLLRQKPAAKIVSPGAKPTPKSVKSVFSITPSRMGKTVTETAKRVYTKDGKRFQETVETITKEDDDGNITKTTKTTTKELDAFDTKNMAAAIDGTKSKKTKGGTRKSSSSSSDSSPERSATKTKSKTSDKPTKGGVLAKIKSKVEAKSTSDDESNDDEDFIEDVFKGVNDCRKKHGVKTLKLNKELNKHAREWAKKLAADEKMAHRPDSKYGENVYCISSNSKTFKVKGQEVVDKWYSESKDHVFGQEPKGTLLKSGHFSQMVWKDTKEMGVGKARSASGTKIFVVANFDPQGNWMGQFAEQVPPVGGFSKSKSASPKKALQSKMKEVSKTSSSSESSSDEEDFAKECLKAHNDYRKKHGVQPLKLSQDLSRYAQEWANNIAKRNVMQHRQPNKYGENIYWFGSSDPNHKIKGKEPVDSWYSEIKDFTFGREPSDLRAGHFTQVVWQDSKELGVGLARSSNGGIYVVCNYDPAGNFVGSFATKVPRPGATPKAVNASPSKNKQSTKPAAKSSSSSSDSDDEDYAKACLKAHNNYRKKHGVPPLKLNKDISKYAQEWANNIASRNTMQHRQPNKYGENIYMSYNPSAEPKGKDPVDSWYSEIKDFTFGREPSTLKSGHFTQVVWKDSKELGVGIARAPSGAVYVVANYNPPGNYTGRYNANVPRPV